MSQTFTEKQIAYNQPLLLWPILGATALLLYGLFRQLVRDIPLGNNPVSNPVLISISIVFILFMLILLNIKLEVSIDDEGLEFRYWPFVSRRKRIPREEIGNIEVVRYKPILEYGGWGYRFSLKTRGRAYTISGRHGIRVNMKNGSHVLFGTKKEDQAVAYLSKWNTKQNPS